MVATVTRLKTSSRVVRNPSRMSTQMGYWLDGVTVVEVNFDIFKLSDGQVGYELIVVFDGDCAVFGHEFYSRIEEIRFGGNKWRVRYDTDCQFVCNGRQAIVTFEIIDGLKVVPSSPADTSDITPFCIVPPTLELVYRDDCGELRQDKV